MGCHLILFNHADMAQTHLSSSKTGEISPDTTQSDFSFLRALTDSSIPFSIKKIN